MKQPSLHIFICLCCMVHLAHMQVKAQPIPTIILSPQSGTVQTEAIQQALDSIGNMPKGGNLIFTKGEYVTGTLTLPSNAYIYLEEEACLLGSINPYDYEGYAYAENSDPNTSDNSRRQFALIKSRGARNVSISGKGMIDGRGLEVALAIDSLHHIGERIDPGYNTKRMRPSIRPKLMDFEDIDSLRIDGVRLRSSASWGLSLDKCSNVAISGIDFVNRAYWNNDGIDISDCTHVHISHCRINSADDGIVLKSFDPLSGNYDIQISHCCITSSANAFKMGTESYGGFRKVRVNDIKVTDTFRSAIALESVDGAVVDDIVIDGVEAVNTGNAIFMRLGHRHGEHPGQFGNVIIRNLRCQIPFGRPDEAYDLRGPDISTIHNPFPNSITGIPEAHIYNVTLENINITHPGRGTKGMAYIGEYRYKDIPENRDSYPEFHMFGELPAWGLYVRHVDGLTLNNVNLQLSEPDYRPAVVMDDVTDVIEDVAIE